MLTIFWPSSRQEAVPSSSKIISEIDQLLARAILEKNAENRRDLYLKACELQNQFCTLRAAEGVCQSPSILELTRRVEQVGLKYGLIESDSTYSSEYHVDILAGQIEEKLFSDNPQNLEVRSIPGGIQVQCILGSTGDTLSLELATDKSQCTLQMGSEEAKVYRPGMHPLPHIVQLLFEL